MAYRNPKRLTSAVLVVAYFTDKLRMSDLVVITISYVVHHITESYEELISPDNLRTEMEKEVIEWEPKKFIIVTIESAAYNFIILGLFIAYVIADWQNVLEHLWTVYDQYIESWNKRVAEEKAKEEATKVKSLQKG